MTLFARLLAPLAVALAAALAGCATPADRAQDLLRQGQAAQAVTLLDAALAEKPDDHHARATLIRARQALASQLLMQIDMARSQGRLDAAQALLVQLRQTDPAHPRLTGLARDLERAERQAQQARDDAARARERPPPPPAPVLPPAMAQAYQKPVSLEFREAPLRSVFEALARSAGVNFVFDKDVRGDAKVTIFLRDVTLDEAVRVVLATQQLERKLLNETTLLLYPNTQAKQREHQELVTRSFYLTNADVKQTQTLVRTLAKSRDIHIDERLNLMVVRDTPQVIALIEHLVAQADLPEPEVLMEVQVMEVGRKRLDELGLQWPSSVSFGLPPTTGSTGAVALLGEHRSFRGWVANPGVVATLLGQSGASNLLANPTIRARNREKAKVQVGEKLPVFTTTSIANVQGVSTTVTYVDLGLKLEIEPLVQLDNEVTMKLNLEVTNLINKESGPNDSVAYRVGTRSATTSVRLRDGETQVLAGLIRDDDRRSAVGIPGLSGLPIAGRLFGVQTDDVDKTEVVLLITPRVLRNVVPAMAGDTQRGAGTEANPGAEALRLRPRARAAVGVSGAGGAPSRATTAGTTSGTTTAEAPAPDPGAVLMLENTAEAAPGGTVAVTLRHDSPATVRGELVFDASRLQAGAGAEARVAFELAPRGQQAVVLRVRPDAPPGPTSVSVGSVSALGPGGESMDLRVEGGGEILIRALRP